MKWRWLTAAALAVYCLWSALLIAQRPGLQYDEALLTSGAIALRHQEVLEFLPRSGDTWTCHFNFCFPLMAGGRYIGAMREYLAVPILAMLGTTAEAVRISSALFGLIGLWGIGVGLGRLASPAIGGLVTMVLAIHPAYLGMTVFDNGAVAPTMAALGWCCWALGAYVTKPGYWPAFWLGAALGFGIWARANFLWTEAAAILAAIVVLRQRAIPPLRHIAVILAGGIVGGLPFLWYQILSHGGTFEAVTLFQSQEPWSKLLAERWFTVRQVLLADSEHLVIWGSRMLPAWQMWFFPAVVAAGIAIVLLLKDRNGSRWPLAQAAGISLLILAAFQFSSRLQIAEHHLIAIVPLAAATSVFGLALLQQRFAGAWRITAAIGVIYTASAFYWNVASIRGLSQTGGIAVWSDAINELTSATKTASVGQQVKILDWGFLEGMLVLSDGSIRVGEWNVVETPALSREGRPWSEEIRGGGLFVLSGADNRTHPEPVHAFLASLAETHPRVRFRQSFRERSGAHFAELLDIEPDTLGQGPPIAAPQQIRIGGDSLLSGFFDPVPEGWRWASKQFRVKAPRERLGQNTLTLRVDGFFPEQQVAALGPITLSARVGEHQLSPFTSAEGGTFHYSSPLKAEWLQGEDAVIDFTVDKSPPPPPGEALSMAVVVQSITIDVQ